MKTRLLSVHLILYALTILLFPGLANADLVAYWDFDYGDIHDKCGNHRGILQGSVKLVTGHRGKGTALQFDGDGYILVKHHPSFDITHEITCSAWIQVNQFDKLWQAIITKGDFAWMFHRGRDTNTIALSARGVVSDDKNGATRMGVSGNRDVTDGLWHHVVAVYDGATASIYVDGGLDKAVPAVGTIWTKDADVQIGANAFRRNREFKGKIDEVAVFNHALDAQEVSQLYNQGAASFLPEGYMKRLITDIRKDIRTHSARAAISAIEKRIKAYKQWRQITPHNIGWRDRELSPEVYFLLAQAKEHANVSGPEVREAYRQVIRRTPNRCEHVPVALLWLYRHSSTHESKRLFREFVRNTDFLSYHLYQAVQYFATQDTWDAYTLLLDAVFSENHLDASSRYLLYQVVVKAMEQKQAWAARFADFSRQQPNLTTCTFFPYEIEAQKLLAQRNYLGAVEVYRRIIDQCPNDRNKGMYEIRMYECLSQAGRYDEAIQHLDGFIESRRASDWSLVSQAIILKGQYRVNQGAINEATDAFLDLVVRYPEAKQRVQAIYFIGYCSLLGGDYEGAKTAFNLLVEAYPNSPYGDKAHTYLRRILDMTE